MKKIIAILATCFVSFAAEAQWNPNSISQYETMLVGTNGTLAAFITNFFNANSNLLNQSVNLSAGPANNATLLNAIIGTASLVATNSTNSSFSGISFVTNLTGPTPFFWISNNVNTNVTSYTASFLGLSNIVTTLQLGNTSLSNIAAFVTVDTSANITAHNFTGTTFSGANEVLKGLSATTTLVLSNQTTSDNLMTWNASGQTAGGWIDPLGGLNLPQAGAITNAAKGWGISTNAQATISNIFVNTPGNGNADIIKFFSNGVQQASIDSNYCVHVSTGNKTNMAVSSYGGAGNGIFFPSGNQVAVASSQIIEMLISNNVIYGNNGMFNFGLFTNIYAQNAQLSNASVSTEWVTNLTSTNTTFLGTLMFTGVTNSTIGLSSTTSSNYFGPFGQTNYVGGLPVFTQTGNGNLNASGTAYANNVFATNSIQFSGGLEIGPFLTLMSFINPNGINEFTFGSSLSLGPLTDGILVAGLYTGAYTNGVRNSAGIDVNGFGTLSNLIVLANETVSTNLTFGAITNAANNFGVNASGAVTATNITVLSSETINTNLTVLGVVTSGNGFASYNTNVLSATPSTSWSVNQQFVGYGYTNTTGTNATYYYNGSGGTIIYFRHGGLFGISIAANPIITNAITTAGGNFRLSPNDGVQVISGSGTNCYVVFGD